MILLALLSLLFIVILAITAIVGILTSDGCIYRYNYNDNPATSTSVLDTVAAPANFAIGVGGGLSQVGIMPNLADTGDIWGGVTGIIEEITGTGAFQTGTGGASSGGSAPSGTLSTGDKITNTVTLKATGNYKATTAQENGSSSVALDPATYGKWLNTTVRLVKNQRVDLSFNGSVSLCKAYIPINNLQDTANLDINNKLIEIPRVDDANPPATLMMDAKTGEWRNLTELFKNDLIQVSLYKDKKGTSTPTVSVYNSLKAGTLTADCQDGATTYSPLCGRYVSFDPQDKYVDKCNFVAECYECNTRQECISPEVAGVCTDGYTTVSDWCSCYQNNYGTPPESYKSDGTFTYPRSENLNDLSANLNRDCATEQAFIDGAYQQQRYFWYSADSATGLLYRFDSSLEPSNKTSLGSDYLFAKIQTDQTAAHGNANYQVILDTTYTADNISYLQYRLYSNNEDYENNSGGYVLNIKQTKCRRVNGVGFDDSFQGRGTIEYIIAPLNADPNNDTSLTPTALAVDANGKGNITAAEQEGYVWLRIKNNPDDYKDSSGQYQVQLTTQVNTGSFQEDALTPLLTGFKNRLKSASSTIYKNMTCYQGEGAEDCVNFFNYIKGILTLYVMTYGMMFLLGTVQISQTDLVIRVIKIGIVAGLMNDSTFEFFNDYIFNFVTDFTDEIIANIAGYSAFAGDEKIGNPLAFMNAILTKIFTGSTFSAQMMAMLTMGLNGQLYFVIVFVCIGIVLIVLVRTITVYLMAQLAIAILMGIAPLFLTFLLFNSTKYLFDNWVKFTFRYMVEPLVLLAGITVLTQLVTIFVDYIVGYSVCWKCAIPFRIPFASIEGITPAFLGVDLLCINWFAPWGMDNRTGDMGINIQYIAILFMLSYALWGYLDFSSQIVTRLVGNMTGPSATVMGSALNNKIEGAAMKQAGLDAKSRAITKRQLGDRLKSLTRSNKKLGSVNRMDMGKQSSKLGNEQEWKAAKEKISQPKIGAHREQAKPKITIGSQREVNVKQEIARDAFRTKPEKEK